MMLYLQLTYRCCFLWTCNWHCMCVTKAPSTIWLMQFEAFLSAKRQHCLASMLPLHRHSVCKPNTQRKAHRNTS